MSEISFLPEELRRKEDQLKKTAPAFPASGAEELKFSLPSEEGEDVEIIEVDEGEVEQVLAGEPFLTRWIFRVTTFLQDVKADFFHPPVEEPPPKLPPQFFQAGAPKPVVQAAAPKEAPKTAMAAGVAPEELAKAKIRIIPSEKAPRRVRVIKRVRKPVRMSFVSEEQLEFLRIDIPKRRFTFLTLLALFTILLGGGTFAVNQLQRSSMRERALAEKQFDDLQKAIQEKRAKWSQFQTLEPKLRALLGLLKSHVSPTHLLDRVERVTLPTVQYTVFTLTPDKKLTLGVMTNSFESAARQLVAFERSGFVQKVETSGYAARYEQEGISVPSSVQFQMTLTLKEEAMKPGVIAQK